MALRQLSRRELLATFLTIGTPTITGCLSNPLGDENSRSIHCPTKSQVGESVHLQVRNFHPRTTVTVECAATDNAEHKYTGSWSLRADENGDATLSNAEPTANTSKQTWYRSERGQRLAKQSAVTMILQRLSFKNLFGSSPNFLMGGQNSVSFSLSFQAHSGLFAPSTPRHSQARILVDPEISRRSVEANGLIGWLYEPSTPGPHPGVITLHGASASVPHRLSKMLATHGYTTFAVQYFDAPGLPESLERIPLEYFDTAIRWLTNRPEVLGGRVGVLGISPVSKPRY